VKIVNEIQNRHLNSRLFKTGVTNMRLAKEFCAAREAFRRD